MISILDNLCKLYFDFITIHYYYCGSLL